MSSAGTVSAARRLAPVTASVLLTALTIWLALPQGVAAREPKLMPIQAVWGLLLAGFVLCEWGQAHVEVRRQTLSVSMSEVPLVLGLYFVHPTALLVIRMTAACLVALRRRTSPYKFAFNVALFTGEVAVACTVFTGVRGSATSGPLTWLAAYAATVCAAGLTGGLVYFAIVRLQGAVARTDVVAMLIPLVAGALLPTTGALLAIVVARADARAIPLFLALVGLSVMAYRAYTRLLRRNRTVAQMSAFTAALSAGGTTQELSDQLLQHTRLLLSAAQASLILDASAHRPLLSRASPESALGEHGEHDEDGDGGMLHALVRSSGRGVLLPRGTRDPAHMAWLAERGLRDVVVVPLMEDEGAVVGTLQVGQREGEMATFGGPDIDVLQMVARHFAAAVRSRDLLEQLSYDARHDPLTGLANRTLFHERMDEAVSARGSQAYAVLLLDLDGFKDVNDTLGHRCGDQMLQEVAGRLRRAVPDAVTVARLGGDEFALLSPVGADPDDVLLIAGLVQRSLRAPLLLGDVELEIRASVGVARCPEHGTDGSLLLQRADVAMYAAKAARQAVQVYDPELDRSNPRRLALVRELRTAIESEQLVCHYQPQVALDGHTVLGAEALVRWLHPVLGMVSPDDFIPIAEHTGLIVPLTSLVLRTALRDCARWRASGRELSVAVNVSPRGLLAPDFVREVAALLIETGLPARALTLEVTESSVMSDPVKATAVLAALHELGVELSVDDFGTGYSSLAYLQRLPVDEVKIDKSFVLDLATDSGDVAIVRAIIDLGHNLGLRVVAEGIEDSRSLDILSHLGCDSAQGYLVSRPLPVEVFESWLATSSTWQAAHVGARTTPRRRLIALG